MIFKWIRRLFLLLILALVGAGAYLWQTMPTRIIPYPYFFTKTSWEGSENAQKANILLVGDRMGMQLAPYLKRINERNDAKLREPLFVYSWARPSEGFHRTLEKLRQLPKWPRIIIFHGLSQEHEEQRFYLKDEQKIITNFFRHDDPKLLSLIMAAPVLSRFIYAPHDLVALEEVIPYQHELSDEDRQRRAALTYLLVHTELQEFVELARERQTDLIFVTTPVNLDVAPRKICDNAQTPTMAQEQRAIETLLESGRVKEASVRIEELTHNTLANARNYFIKGKTAKAQGDYSVAQGALQLAAVYDCEAWRSHAIYNQMLLRTADSHHFHVLDFDFAVNQNFGRDVLFLNELFPQDIYYQRIADEISQTVEKILRL